MSKLTFCKSAKDTCPWKNDILLRELDEYGILRLTLNDVSRRNALSEAMLMALGAAFVEAGNNLAARVIILAANGPTYCTGHDLKEMTSGRAASDDGKSYFAMVMAKCSGVMQGILNGSVAKFLRA